MCKIGTLNFSMGFNIVAPYMVTATPEYIPPTLMYLYMSQEYEKIPNKLIIVVKDVEPFLLKSAYGLSCSEIVEEKAQILAELEYDSFY